MNKNLFVAAALILLGTAAIAAHESEPGRDFPTPWHTDPAREPARPHGNDSSSPAARRQENADPERARREGPMPGSEQDETQVRPPYFDDQTREELREPYRSRMPARRP